MYLCFHILQLEQEDMLFLAAAFGLIIERTKYVLI